MTLLALHAGDFGAAVAARLIEDDPDARELSLLADAKAIEDAVARSAFVAVATWRPYVDLCQWLDDVCHRHAVRWSVVEIAGTTLSCGPLIAPRLGVACYHCYVARLDAHRREGDRRRVLRQAYAADAGLGAPGHTPAMLAIAEAALRDGALGGVPGRFRHVDVLSGSVLESELIPLHDCPRCRPPKPGHDPKRRYVDVMSAELEKLIP